MLPSPFGGSLEDYLPDAGEECPGGVCSVPRAPAPSFPIPSDGGASSELPTLGFGADVAPWVPFGGDRIPSRFDFFAQLAAAERSVSAAEAARPVPPVTASSPARPLAMANGSSSSGGPDWGQLVDKLSTAALDVFKTQTQADVDRSKIKAQTAADVATVRAGGTPRGPGGGGLGFDLQGLGGIIVPGIALAIGAKLLMKLLGGR